MIYVEKEKLVQLYQQFGKICKVAEYLNINRESIRKLFIFHKISYLSKELHNSNNRKHIFNEMYFENLNTPNIAYWLGFLAADGAVSNKCLALGLAQKDEYHLLSLKEDLKANSTNIYRTSQSKSKKTELPIVISRIQFSSKKLVQTLNKFNITPNKSLTYSFSENLKVSKFINKYLLGYLDGDGCWRIKKEQLTFDLRGTEKFLSTFNKILIEQCNLPQKCLNKKLYYDGSTYRIIYSGNNLCAKVANWLYSDLNSSRFLIRKYEIIKPYLRIN